VSGFKTPAIWHNFSGKTIRVSDRLSSFLSGVKNNPANFDPQHFFTTFGNPQLFKVNP
jgi:hypothetical protein